MRPSRAIADLLVRGSPAAVEDGRSIAAGSGPRRPDPPVDTAVNFSDWYFRRFDRGTSGVSVRGWPAGNLWT